jgi:anti-sigma B factor antagonist
MSLSLKTRRIGNRLVIDIVGRLTVLDQGLSHLVLNCIKGGDLHFVLNMKELSYLDSSELAQLLSIHAAVKEAGGTLVLSAPNPEIRKMLDITKLETVFEIITDDRWLTRDSA